MFQNNHQNCDCLVTRSISENIVCIVVRLMTLRKIPGTLRDEKLSFFGAPCNQSQTTGHTRHTYLKDLKFPMMSVSVWLHLQGDFNLHAAYALYYIDCMCKCVALRTSSQCTETKKQPCLTKDRRVFLNSYIRTMSSVEVYDFVQQLFSLFT